MKYYPLCWLSMSAAITAHTYAGDDYSLKNAKYVDTERWECTLCASNNEWSGSTTIGAGYVDNDGSSRFNNWVPTHSDTGAVGTFGADMSKYSDDGEYIEFKVEDLGLERYLFSTEFGRYDGFRGSIRYSQSPYYWNNSSLSVYSGDNEVLTQGELKKFDKKVVREKMGIGLAYTPYSPWQPYVDMTFEKKEGTYSYYTNTVPGVGSVPGYIPKPISQETLNTQAGISYLQEDWMVDVVYHTSIFRNSNEVLYFGPPSNPFEDARAYEPDNEFHQVAVSGNYRWDQQTVDGRVLWQESTSDGGLNGFPNSPNQKDEFNGQVNTIQFDVGYFNRINSKTSVKANVDYRDRDDKSDSDAVIGQPREMTDRSQIRLNAVMKYRYNRSLRVSVGYDYRHKERDNAERKRTDEQIVYVGTRYKPKADWSGGAKLSLQSRDGSSWNNDQSDNPNLRQYHLADRDRIELRGDVVYQISEPVQLTLEAWYGDDDYPTPDIGISEDKDYGYNLGINYQLDQDTSGHAYLNQQRVESKQQHANSNVPDWSRYSTKLDDESIVLGLGVNRDNLLEKKLNVSLDYSYSYGKGKTNTTSTAEYPNVTAKGHRIEFNGDYQLDENQSLKVNVKYEYYDESDYLFNADEANLGLVDQKYDGYFGMVSWEYRY